jgi:hypothetical protein
VQAAVVHAVLVAALAAVVTAIVMIAADLDMMLK